ncbi:uncharacterized protein LOC127737558 [Mytilus californianus]|uniref:uncharacterized protein LOC127737558 n=1 Tax=Mytilus californianus TaxID=6549 RepID=UPI00224718EB|nr:uncharacterized protein LOC127737558 [Mytilus californianus]
MEDPYQLDDDVPITVVCNVQKAIINVIFGDGHTAMEELLKNPDIQGKIKRLSPHVRKAFVESLLDLFEQETEDMIDAIEESRMELRGTMLDFEDETEQLRAESRMLEQRRMDYERNCVNKYLDEKGRKSRSSSSRISFIDERSDENKASVKDYMRRKEQSRLMFNESRSPSSLSVPSLAPVERPISAQTSRSLPSPSPIMSKKALQAETDAIMQNLSTADNKLATERYRQTELLEERKARRKETHKSREEQALELLEKALMMDKQLTAKKEAQEKRLKERLEEMKRKKERTMCESVEPSDRLEDFERF